MKIDYKELGKKIRQIRTDHHLTIEQMAEMLNLSASYMGLIERGQRGISIETLHRFATLFDISTDYLLFADHSHTPRNLGMAYNSHHQQILHLTREYSENDMRFLVDFIKLHSSYNV